MDNKNLVTLLTSFFALVKLILNMQGVVIPDELINAFVNGICAVVSMWGIWITHDKPVQITTPVATVIMPQPATIPDTIQTS